MLTGKFGAHGGGQFWAKVDQHKGQLAHIARPNSLDRGVVGDQMLGQGIHRGEKEDGDGQKGDALAGGGKGRLDHEISLALWQVPQGKRAVSQGQGLLARVIRHALAGGPSRRAVAR